MMFSCLLCVRSCLKDSLFQFLYKLFDRVQPLLWGGLQRLTVSVDVNIPQRL